RTYSAGVRGQGRHQQLHPFEGDAGRKSSLPELGKDSGRSRCRTRNSGRPSRAIGVTDPRLIELQEALEGLDVSLTTLRVAIRRFRSRPPNSTLALTRTHRGRGIAIIPGSVKQARLQAGLSLAEVAGKEITRVAVWYV